MKCILAVFILMHTGIYSQEVRKPVTKGKVPVITASIGGLTTGSYSLATVKSIIDSALVLKDAAGKKYPVNRCSFLYKRKLSFKDEETGETKITWEYVNKELRNNAPLENYYKAILKEDLKKGEALIFGKILADSQKGYMVPVKEIVITVQ
jgi:hypothetical protein